MFSKIRTWPLRRTVSSLAVLAVVALTGCGDDDQDAIERYCELTRALDRAGEEFFAELEADESATEEDYARREREFLENFRGDFAQIGDIAPDGIRDDVQVLLKTREGLAEGSEPSAAELEAEERVQAFEAEHCL